MRQSNKSGIWVAVSAGSVDAYEIEVNNGNPYSCSCPAAEHGDPVCKHRAMLLHMQGKLDLIEEDE